jgi:phenylpropionate dioxygenase-like ring-hydroxylating dioxygenase large terminal subunit
MLATKQPLLRRFWYPVVPIAHLESGPKPFTLLGVDMVLWLDEIGSPAAVLDRCCHRTARLSRGFCDGGQIVCGYHGWAYDRTGKCVRVPQWGEAQRRNNFSVPAYRCVQRYGYAWVALEDPIYDIPEIPEAADPAFRRIDQFYEEWRCAGLRLMENSFDIAHPAFVHRKTFGIQASPEITSFPEITPVEGGFHYVAESRVKNPDIQKKNLNMDEEQTTRRRLNTWWMPFVRKLGIHYPSGLRHSIITAATPIDDARSMVVQFCYRNDTEAEAKAADIIAFDREVTLEDKYILETTDPDVPLADFAETERSMRTDKAGVMMRTMLRELLAKYGEAEVHGRSGADSTTLAAE